MVTAEFAVAMPVLAIVIAAVINIGAAVSAKLSCTDSARAGARAAARAESDSQIRQIVSQVSGSAVNVEIRRDSLITVTVRRSGGSLPVVGGELRTSCTAVSYAEEQQRGSATVYFLIIVSFIAALAGGLILVGQARIARHQAQAAADLAALAAAETLRDPWAGLPKSGAEATAAACALARSVAAANRSELAHCALAQGTVLIEVRHSPGVGLPEAGVARAWARAGFPESAFPLGPLPPEMRELPGDPERFARSHVLTYASDAVLGAEKVSYAGPVEAALSPAAKAWHLSSQRQKPTKHWCYTCHPKCRSPPQYLRHRGRAPAPGMRQEGVELSRWQSLLSNISPEDWNLFNGDAAAEHFLNQLSSHMPLS